MSPLLLVASIPVIRISNYFVYQSINWWLLIEIHVPLVSQLVIHQNNQNYYNSTIDAIIDWKIKLCVQ